MHSHHSHSGDYVAHAADTLPAIVAAAKTRGFTTYCLTEHIPRETVKDLYPEESHLDVAALEDTFARYYKHARAIQAEYAESGMQLLVGFEADYIRPTYAELLRNLREKYAFDMFVGSIHHVAEIPIDYDQAQWDLAAQTCGGIVGLFEAYFDEQYAMLTELQPPVVGHFDLIRLFATTHSTTPLATWPSVLAKAERNIRYIASYGGLVEINSAAVRKGWAEPYPRRDVCDLVIANGGRFALSDDSHSIAQVGLNYHKSLDHVLSLGLAEIHYLALDKGATVVRAISVADLARSPFWADAA
ncbi:polymerase/histidinol phosphatase-like protein [Dipodascopsis tothii]|uniref:polymerase/histidinol phosphatase-like protein n=1 Tax=Dipodascopsis tothii TaxID=44089 RepID=UPI0034CDBA9B